MSSAAPATTSPSDSLGVLVGHLKSELVRALEQELSRLGLDLRFSQVQVIKHLHLAGTMSAGDLARALNLDCGAVTRLVDQLEQRGYLHRHRDPTDRRALRIELSATGEALYPQLADCSQRVLEASQAALNEVERRHLTAYLQRVLTTLQQTH